MRGLVSFVHWFQNWIDIYLFLWGFKIDFLGLHLLNFLRRNQERWIHSLFSVHGNARFSHNWNCLYILNTLRSSSNFRLISFCVLRFKLILEKKLHLKLFLVLLPIIQNLICLFGCFTRKLTWLDRSWRLENLRFFLVHLTYHLICIRIQNGLIDIWYSNLRFFSSDDKRSCLFDPLGEVFVA